METLTTLDTLNIGYFMAPPYRPLAWTVQPPDRGELAAHWTDRSRGGSSIEGVRRGVAALRGGRAARESTTARSSRPGGPRWTRSKSFIKFI